MARAQGRSILLTTHFSGADEARSTSELRSLSPVLGKRGGTMVSAKVRCIGCGGLVPQMDWPTHRYMESSPGCWYVYGEVLSREYSDLAFGALHRLTVDSYAVQHPGRPSPQSIQSVCVHLISLCLAVERGVELAYATRVMGAAVRTKERFVWLTPPRSVGEITVGDVAAVSTAAAHVQIVRAWAESAWSAWGDHHQMVRSWLPERG